MKSCNQEPMIEDWTSGRYGSTEMALSFRGTVEQ